MNDLTLLPLTKEEWETLEYLMNNACSGPWKVVTYQNVNYVEHGPVNDPSDCFDVFEDPSKTTCEFVAACMNLMPRILQYQKKG